MILGMSFCKDLSLLQSAHVNLISFFYTVRNVYTLLDFGSWANGNSSDHPFIQLVPITNSVQARQDFINIRLGGTDTTGSGQWALLPAGQGQQSPVTAEEKKQLEQEKILSHWPWILFGCLVFVILVVGLCIWKCCCRRGQCCNKGKKNVVKKSQIPFSTQPSGPQTYVALDEPSLSQGVYNGGKYPSDSTYSVNSYSPGYPPNGHTTEPGSPAHSTHSFDTSHYPPPQYTTQSPYSR